MKKIFLLVLITLLISSAHAIPTHVTVSVTGSIAGCTPNVKKASLNESLGIIKNTMKLKECTSNFVKKGVTAVVCRSPFTVIVGFYDSLKDCELFGRMSGVFKGD